MTTADAHRSRLLPTRRHYRVASGLILAMIMLGGSARLSAPATIVVPQEVPPEVTELVRSTWASFLAAFPAKQDCVGTVELILVTDVAGGDAAYSPEEPQIRIEIPTTPARFPESLAHELGHHLERACNAAAEIGREFVVAEGLDPDADWYLGDLWFKVPSEHFAETVVWLVMGDRLLHSDIMPLSENTIRLVSEWGQH